MPDFEIFEAITSEEHTDLTLPIGLEIFEFFTISEETIVSGTLMVEASELLNLTEETLLFFDNLFVNIFNALTVEEFLLLCLDMLYQSNSDSILILEYIDIVDLIIEVEISDSVLIAEELKILRLSYINNFDEITIAESIEPNLTITLERFEEIYILQSAYLLDIVIELFAYETINSADRGFIFRVENFSEFLRGYPFVEITEAEIDKIEFENGIVQMIDRWGRTRKTFQITLPVSTKSEAMPVKEFYERNIGRRFYFTNPVDHKTYNVTFLDNSYRLERSHYDTYEAEVGLVEVF